MADPRYKNAPYRAVHYNANGHAQSRNFKTRKEAEAFLKKVNKDLAFRESITKSGVTFRAAVPAFQEKKETDGRLKKERSIQTFRGDIAIANELFGDCYLENINEDIVKKSLATSGYSPSVQRKVKQIVIGVLEKACADGFILSVPVIHFDIPNSEGPRKRKGSNKEFVGDNWMTDEEIAIYEAECAKTYTPKKYTKHAGEVIPAHPAGLRLLLILHTGLRSGEALALTWDDFDERSKSLTISKNVARSNGQRIIQSPKTKSGRRIIVLNKKALADIRALREVFNTQTVVLEEKEIADCEAAKRQYEGHQLKERLKEIADTYKGYREQHKFICGATVFPFGGASHANTLDAHNRICKAIKLSHSVNVHGLRHSYVTHYYNTHCTDPDFDLAKFSQELGHASPRTTMEIYRHLDFTKVLHTARTEEELPDF